MCAAKYSTLVKTVAPPSFCSSASLSSFLPACIFFPCLLLSHLSSPMESVGRTSDMEIDIQRGSRLWWASAAKNLAGKNRHTGLRLPLFLFNCLFLSLFQKHILCWSLLWCFNYNVSPSLCMDANSSRHNYCVFPPSYALLSKYFACISHTDEFFGSTISLSCVH